jgi:hypothetical protein
MLPSVADPSPLTTWRGLIAQWAAQIEPHVVEAAETYDDAPTVEEWRTSIDQLINDFVVPAGQEN